MQEQGKAKPCILTSILESRNETDINYESEDVTINVTGLAFAGTLLMIHSSLFTAH